MPLTTPYDKPTRPRRCSTTGRSSTPFSCRCRCSSRSRRLQPPGGPGEPFAVESRTARGVTRIREARNVVLAMGYYTQPNMLNIPGEDLPHVTHFYKEAHPYYRQRVVIVGGKNSAAEAALEIHRAGGHVTMVHRGAGVRRLDQVLGEARHRESRQGRIDRRALQRARRRDSSERGRARFGHDAARRSGAAADRLSRRSGVHAPHRRRDRSRDARTEVQRRDLRDQRARVCSSPAVSWPGRRREPCSSRTAGSTAR